MTDPPCAAPVFLALGSNLGDAQEHVLRACAALRVRFPGSHRVSALYRTLPVDCPPGSGAFINAVVMIESFEHPPPPPTELLCGLMMIERAFGRLQRKQRNEPRVLDLDIIAAGSLRGTFGDLEIPHRRAHLRSFVMLPMAELAPTFVLPGQTLSTAELAASLDPSGCEKL